MAMARTGSGKTAAFLVPMFQRLKMRSAKSGMERGGGGGGGKKGSPIREWKEKEERGERQVWYRKRVGERGATSWIWKEKRRKERRRIWKEKRRKERRRIEGRDKSDLEREKEEREEREEEDKGERQVGYGKRGGG